MANLFAYDLPGIVNEFDHLRSDAQQTFGSLSPQQLNWQANADQWSIGQCFDHMIKATRPYFPAFDQVIRGEKKNSLWESMPLLPGLFGKLLIQSFDPASSMKFQAPAIFRPTSSDVPAHIVDDFLKTQDELCTRLNAAAGADWMRIKITSPASPFVTYSLRDAYLILLTHEQLHLYQARSVLQWPGFGKL